MANEDLNMEFQAGIMSRYQDKRYDFHHEAGWAQQLRNKEFEISLVDERTTERVTYVLPSEVRQAHKFPLRELLYTFAEQVGVRVAQLEFRYQGKLVPLNATPESLGMVPSFLDGDNVIAVSTIACPHERRVEIFTLLNRLGKATVGIGPHQGDMFGSDLLPRILEFAGLEVLVNACQVCRHWFHVTQRYSVLVQLQDGDATTWQQGQQYPRLLHDGCRHSFNLALCQAMERGGSGSVSAASTLIEKETTNNHAFGYCKAAGCVMFKTVYMESISRDLESKWEALNDAKTAFMNHLETTEPVIDSSRIDVSAGDQLQELPPKGKEGNGFIAEARDWRYKNCTVELYRRYFSPEMFYIFPAMVNQQAGVGLDFRTCTTSLIFGTPPEEDHTAGNETRRERLQRLRLQRLHRIRGSRDPPQPGDGLPGPLGSVSWRVHDAEEIAAKGLGLNTHTSPEMPDADPLVMMNGSKPQIVLEVLFIAVWDSFRGGEYGSALVADLESKALACAKAKGHKSALMYVEIGFEQPLAKKFWGNNGFAPAIRAGQGHSVDDVLTRRIVELEDWQLSFIDRRCLRFKDTEQYAKRVLVE